MPFPACIDILLTIVRYYKLSKRKALLRDLAKEMLMQSDNQRPRGDDRRGVERRKHPRTEISAPDRRDGERRAASDRPQNA